MNDKKVIIIGAGLAGVEAAYQVSKRGIAVELYEMRPQTQTEVHATGSLGEMVCSNSLGSTQLTAASGLLKEELKLLDSFFLRIAEKSRVPAGSSFSVDRIALAEDITREIEAVSNITVIKKEIAGIPAPGDCDCPVIVASGPLTSGLLATSIMDFTMRKNLFFYDATSPIIDAESIDFDKVYMASRYDKGEADFVNIPLDEEQYLQLVKDLLDADKVEVGAADKNIFFDACLPVEEIARSGEKSLSFGPLKPVGLNDPRTGKMPHAVIQLRQDDLKKNFFQMVGFQTRMKWDDQKRVFRKLPGLENARFERFGRMHRNSYINAPLLLDTSYSTRMRQDLYFAGQICGVEGYVESISSGLLAGIYAAGQVLGTPFPQVPENTACGALVHYICNADWQNFRPTKFTFGLLPEIDLGKVPRKGRKHLKKEKKSAAALESLTEWKKKAAI
ncbi:MAG: methylenetetrahydrofolate--tRNA-(uracil(54)-C(5))-methyltransferase (FADH(2)-oxidizing) TrmFO [bacterium]|nr:methylenetetrahydrofolate--tRNA-(uracil(54)-C(5))-methyltransferase (FADH(2)-oxidizing) TrmFO [bacterium]